MVFFFLITLLAHPERGPSSLTTATVRRLLNLAERFLSRLTVAVVGVSGIGFLPLLNRLSLWWDSPVKRKKRGGGGGSYAGFGNPPRQLTAILRFSVAAQGGGRTRDRETSLAVLSFWRLLFSFFQVMHSVLPAALVSLQLARECLAFLRLIHRLRPWPGCFLLFCFAAMCGQGVG